MDSVIILLVALMLYLIPSVVAYARKHKNFKAILVLNILLGWTFLGWVGCLVWSFTSNTKQPEVVDKVVNNQANVDKATQDMARKFYLVSADTKERIKGFYTDEGALKCIEENGFTVANVRKNDEGGMDFTVVTAES